MEREYTIELMEFVGVYFPKLHRITVSAFNVEEAIEKAFGEVGVILYPEDIESAKEDIDEDSYNEMFNPRSNDYMAIKYNYILDVYKESSYRLLRGYCGKRKCFDIVLKDKYSI